MFEPLSAAQLTNHTDDDDDNDDDKKRAPFSTDAIPSMAAPSFGPLREEEAGGDRRRGNGCININERTNKPG